MTIPDWQLPPGVDRGLWDYLHAEDMVQNYNEQVLASPLARADLVFCERHFSQPGRLLDLGCGTGRLCLHFAAKGYHCLGVDLSPKMLEVACQSTPAALMDRLQWCQANIAEPLPLPDGSFDYIACLYSTLGMIRGPVHRAAVLANIRRLLHPKGCAVLHVHHRFFRGLGFRQLCRQGWLTLLRHPHAGDITMPQAYAGAPLTLHHFTRSELLQLVHLHGLSITEWHALDEQGQSARGLRIYGWLLALRHSPVSGKLPRPSHGKLC
jgi:SAM-dependent methyltransferase